MTTTKRGHTSAETPVREFAKKNRRSKQQIDTNYHPAQIKCLSNEPLNFPDNLLRRLTLTTLTHLTHHVLICTYKKLTKGKNNLINFIRFTKAKNELTLNSKD